jgi:tryptophan-rich sensory protein
MKIPQIIKLIIALVVPLSVGAIAGLFTADAIPDWYASLNRPSFNPPNWLFGPVWTTLYTIMGISLFLIWKQNPSKQRNQAIAFFFFHLFLNFCWSFIFFYFKMIGAAFVEIILLWTSIVGTLILFYRIKPVAAYINIPYLVWVTFASVLNGAYYFLN